MEKFLAIPPPLPYWKTWNMIFIFWLAQEIRFHVFLHFLHSSIIYRGRARNFSKTQGGGGPHLNSWLAPRFTWCFALRGSFMHISNIFPYFFIFFTYPSYFFFIFPTYSFLEISPSPRTYIQGKKLKIFPSLIRQDNVIGGEGVPHEIRLRGWNRENGTNFRKWSFFLNFPECHVIREGGSRIPIMGVVQGGRRDMKHVKNFEGFS